MVTSIDMLSSRTWLRVVITISSSCTAIKSRSPEQRTTSSMLQMIRTHQHQDRAILLHLWAARARPFLPAVQFPSSAPLARKRTTKARATSSRCRKAPPQGTSPRQATVTEAQACSKWGGSPLAPYPHLEAGT